MKKLRRGKKKPGGEGGQAILEFLLVTMMIITLLFVFVQLSWGIAYGHYVHYGTFMASRAYLASGVTNQDQTSAATDSLNGYLKTKSGKDLFPFIAVARTGGDCDSNGGSEPVPGAAMGQHSEVKGHEHERAYSWAEGVQYNYNLKLFLLPISAMIAKDGEGKTITPGSNAMPSRTIQWKGAIPFTSDSFLGRDPNTGECWSFMARMSASFGISRADGKEFIEDNGC